MLKLMSLVMVSLIALSAGGGHAQNNRSPGQRLRSLPGVDQGGQF